MFWYVQSLENSGEHQGWKIKHKAGESFCTCHNISVLLKAKWLFFFMTVITMMLMLWSYCFLCRSNKGPKQHSASMWLTLVHFTCYCQFWSKVLTLSRLSWLSEINMVMFFINILKTFTICRFLFEIWTLVSSICLPWSYAFESDCSSQQPSCTVYPCQFLANYISLSRVSDLSLRNK